MRLVWNWRRAHRMFVMQGLALIAAIQSVLLIIPPEKAQAIVPFTAATTWADLGLALTIGGAVLSVLGRLIDQGAVTQPPASQSDRADPNAARCRPCAEEKDAGILPAARPTDPQPNQEQIMFNFANFKARMDAIQALLPAVGQMVQLAEAIAPAAPGLKKADLVIQMITAAEPEIVSTGLNLASTITSMVNLFRAAGTLPQQPASAPTQPAATQQPATSFPG